MAFKHKFTYEEKVKIFLNTLMEHMGSEKYVNVMILIKVL